MPTTRNPALRTFADVEVPDLCGPFEASSVAGRFTESPAFTVLAAAGNAGPVMTRGGLSVNPHRRLLDCPPPGVPPAPGGQGARKGTRNPALTDRLRQASAEAEPVLPACTGALLLAEAGLPGGLGAATHRGAIGLLRQTAAGTAVHAGRRFVDSGRAVCSAGVAAGIDRSRHVAGRLLGREVAVRTAQQMEYP